MGFLIRKLSTLVEVFSKDNKANLRIGGGILTAIVVLSSGGIGWVLEQLLLKESQFPYSIGSVLFCIALASGLAARSLIQSVNDVINSLPNDNNQSLYNAREKLKLIVGRDVNQLDRNEILRATAETASENAVDGIFAPLFWILIGSLIWKISDTLPGPLSCLWAFKATSTIDSMIGYKIGRMEWLGTIGARLDDLLVWIPCRLVVITLPLISKRPTEIKKVIKATWIDGSRDISPNSGLSQAVFAYCVKARMGGSNKYKSAIIEKPILAKYYSNPSIHSINNILNLCIKLEFFWLLLMSSLLIL